MLTKPVSLLLISLILFSIPFETRSQTGYRGPFSIENEQFAIWNGREYIPVFMKGINMGIAVPGTQPGQLAASRVDYRRWFHLIREAGYNTIRLYTLHYPRFYEELHRFNTEYPANPLLVIQGIWLDEQETPTDLFDLTSGFSQEIREVVRAVHGDIFIQSRFGKAYGDYSTDISRWVAGYLIGREVFPSEVALTNLGHPEENSYNGTYFQLEGGVDPAEVWVAQRLDSLTIYESQHFRSVRPVGFTSWPTLDPLTHPTEQLWENSQEDDEKIDLSGMITADSSAGFFVSYHAYPYYPDFIVQDPHYGFESDSAGPNSYLGYLKDLKAHYEGIPLLIAEFGVPSSWGSAHLTPSGMHHGGLTEEQQGRYTIRMLDNIREAGCAGGIQFSLIDEWFKQTWITNPYSDKHFRHLWHNITTPEQNFGILSYAPPPFPFTEVGFFPGKAISRVRVVSDYTFFRIRVYMDAEQYPGDTLWVALDTYEKDLGESILPDGTSVGGETDTLRAEFVLRIPLEGSEAGLYVIPSYDVYGIKQPVRLDTVVSVKSDAGSWNPVRWKTNYFYNITQQVGRLRISQNEDAYQFLNAVTIFNDSLEIRVPWTLINFTAPNLRRAMHYLSTSDGEEIVVLQKDTLSEGIAFTLLLGDELYQADRYSWDFWDHEKILADPPIERKKQSFYYLRRKLPLFNSAPVGYADTFSIWPGDYLILDEAGGLMANDFDIDGNRMLAALALGNTTTNGSLYLHPDGSFSYHPDPGFRGNDFFMYYLDDGYTYSTLVPVTIRVDFPLDYEAFTVKGTGKHFEIYPNPGKDLFHIRTLKPFDEALVLITDIMGREIATVQLHQAETPIMLENVLPGTYFFRIYVDHTIDLHKIIIH